MDELTLKTIKEFNSLPETDETREIKRQYLSDEISSYEFFCSAQEHLDKIKE